MREADSPLRESASLSEAGGCSVELQARAATIVEDHLNLTEGNFADTRAQSLGDGFFSRPSRSQRVGAAFAGSQFI